MKLTQCYACGFDYVSPGFKFWQKEEGISKRKGKNKNVEMEFALDTHDKKHVHYMSKRSA